MTEQNPPSLLTGFNLGNFQELINMYIFVIQEIKIINKKRHEFEKQLYNK